MELILYPLIGLYDWFFQHFYNVTSSYGLAIILLSIFVSTIMLPLFWFGDRILDRGAAQRQKMQAELDSLKDVPESLERYYYTRRIYRIYGYHPIQSLSNLLGLLIQIPFFLAAYFYLSHSEALKGVGFLGIPDLSQADGLLYGIHFLPLLMTLFNVLAAELYLLAHPRQNLRSARIQQYSIAVLFLVLLYPLASGLLLYWTCNNLYSLIKNGLVYYRKLKRAKDTFNSTIGDYKIEFTYKNIINNSNILLLLILLSSSITISHSKYALVLSTIIFFSLIIFQYRKIVSFYKKKLSDIKLYQIMLNLFLLILSYAVLNFFVRFLMGKMVNPIIVLPVFIDNIKVLDILLFIGNIILYKNIFKRDLAYYTAIFIRKKIANLHVTKSIYGLVTLTLLLQIFVYTPIILILGAPIELGIDSSIFSYVFLSIFLSVLISAYVRKIKNKLPKVFVNITFLLLLVMILVNFTYGYLFELDLGIIRGVRFVNENLLTHLSSTLQIMEICLLLIIVITSVCVGKYLQKYAKYICILVNFILIVNVYSTLKDHYNEINQVMVSSRSKAADEADNKILDSYFEKNHDLYNFSKDKNILVIILDAFPANMLQNIINENPKIFESLTGFVWYDHSVSTGNFTANSVNAMVAGPDFVLSEINKNNEIKLSKLQSNNWAKLFNAVHKQGYDTSGRPIVGDRTHFSNQLEAPIHFNSSPNLQQNIEINWAFVTNLTLFKIFPLTVKKLIYSYGNWFIPITKIDDRYQHFREYMALDNMAKKITSDSPIPTFKYFWYSLNIAPFLVNERGEWISSKDLKNGFDQYSDLSRKYTAKYLMGIMAELADSLKKQGVYNNTKIIIASDHGSAESNWNEKALYSLMMVKDFNAKETFQISDIPTSNSDIPAMIGTGIDPSGEFNSKYSYGRDYTKNPDMQRILKYHITLHGSYAEEAKSTKYPPGTLITIQGDPYDKKNWKYSKFE